jgi:hypothetical protein
MWLKKAFAKVAPVMGKAKGGLDSGLKMFDKARTMYTEAKKTIEGVPLVGNVAADLIKKQEEKANVYAKKKTGVNFSDVNKAVGVAREVQKVAGEVQKFLPPAM